MQILKTDSLYSTTVLILLQLETFKDKLHHPRRWVLISMKFDIDLCTYGGDPLNQKTADGWTDRALYVIRSGKTGPMYTLTEIHFLSVCESYTHAYALPRYTKYILDHR